jgi:hypothetical protein
MDGGQGPNHHNPWLSYRRNCAIGLNRKPVRQPVNNCGGIHDFSEILVSNLEKWQPATERAAEPADGDDHLASIP